MSNSVDILIKADDKTSQAFQSVSNRLDSVKGKQADFAKQTKTSSETIAALASLLGNSELAGYASALAGATEKLSQFSEAAKAGGSSSLMFKAGLVGLAATIGAGIGKALGDLIFQTAKFEKAMELAKNQASELDKQVVSLQRHMMDARKEDIELIRDPEEKRAAQKQLLDELNRDIAAISRNVRAGKKEVEEWSDAWQITGERKALAVMAEEQLKQDQERLAVLKSERDEILRTTGEQSRLNAARKAANEAKDKSEAYIDTLAKEVEYLKATRDEQIKLDAVRNTTLEDRNEAEQLLKERDAILAKIEAEKLLMDERKRAAEEQKRNQERAIQDAEREAQSIADLVRSEFERLEVQRIEIEQGREAARVQELKNKGVSEGTAQQIAAEQMQLDMMKKLLEPPKDTKLTATEGRLLTRGPASTPQDRMMRQTVQFLNVIAQAAQQNVQQAITTSRVLGQIDDNTSNTVQLVATK